MMTARTNIVTASLLSLLSVLYAPDSFAVQYYLCSYCKQSDGCNSGNTFPPPEAQACGVYETNAEAIAAGASALGVSCNIGSTAGDGIMYPYGVSASSIAYSSSGVAMCNGSTGRMYRGITTENPLPDCSGNTGQSIGLTGSGQPPSTVCGSDHCEMTKSGPVDVYIPGTNEYAATYQYTGDSCAATTGGLDESIPPDSNGCVTSSSTGLNLCSTPDGNIVINGKSTSGVTLIPPSACAYINGGNFACSTTVGDSPPAPDDGTPGSKATPGVTVTYPDGSSYDIYDPGTVDGSSFTPSGVTGGGAGDDNIYSKLSGIYDTLNEMGGDAGTGETAPDSDGSDEYGSLSGDPSGEGDYENPLEDNDVVDLFNVMQSISCTPWTVGTIVGQSFVLNLCPIAPAVKSLLEYLLVGLLVIGIWHKAREAI